MGFASAISHTHTHSLSLTHIHTLSHSHSLSHTHTLSLFLTGYSWIVRIIGAEGTLYAGQQFDLRFTYPSMYPMEAPEVIFVGQNIPCHPHIYSNGAFLFDILNPFNDSLSLFLSCFLESNSSLAHQKGSLFL